MEIDTRGSDGNAFALMGRAKTYAKQMGLDHKPIIEDMQSFDYDHLLDVFEKHFGLVCTLIRKEPWEDDHEEDGDY